MGTRIVPSTTTALAPISSTNPVALTTYTSSAPLVAGTRYASPVSTGPYVNYRNVSQPVTIQQRPVTTLQPITTQPIYTQQRLISAQPISIQQSPTTNRGFVTVQQYQPGQVLRPSNTLIDPITYPGTRQVVDAIQLTSAPTYNQLANNNAMYRGATAPARLAGSLATSNEIIASNRQAQTVASTEEARAKTRAFRDQQHQIEEDYFRQAKVCPVQRMKFLQDRLGSLNPQEFKALLQNNFYDAEIMKAAMCVAESIAYTPPLEVGGVASNFRIKHWIRDLQRIGAESVQGFALRGDLEDAKNVFIVKAPRDPEDPMLLHEYFVGIYGTNKLRAEVPNFAYVLGGFKCSLPVIEDQTKKVLAWCNNKNYPIDYVIYENIAPAVTMREWITKNCDFNRWLVYYLQIMYATQLAADKIDYTHYDLHDENVLIREVPTATRDFAIPYKTERGVIEYLQTDKVATIIDFGLTHIKYQGQNFGVYDRLAWGVLPTRSFPLHDAYKLLLWSMKTMLISGQRDCFNKASIILKFFNSTESADTIVNMQAQTYYYLPFNEKTAGLNIYDLTRFIRQNFDTSAILRPSAAGIRVLGCQGDDICISERGATEKLGLMMQPRADNVFEFYDLVTRLQAENREDEIQRVIRGFNYEIAGPQAKKEYNDAIIKLNDTMQNLLIYQVANQPISVWFNPTYTESYRNYIAKVASVYNNLQETDLLQEALVYTATVYGDDKTVNEIVNSYNKLRQDIDPIWIQIINNIAQDINYVQNLAADPQVNAQINQIIVTNSQYDLLWWWQTFPQIMQVIS